MVRSAGTVVTRNGAAGLSWNGGVIAGREGTEWRGRYGEMEKARGVVGWLVKADKACRVGASHGLQRRGKSCPGTAMQVRFSPRDCGNAGRDHWGFSTRR